jgi:hypothetical protein
LTLKRQNKCDLTEKYFNKGKIEKYKNKIFLLNYQNYGIRN